MCYYKPITYKHTSQQSANKNKQFLQKRLSCLVTNVPKKFLMFNGWLVKLVGKYNWMAGCYYVADYISSAKGHIQKGIKR